jgi:dTDP-4-amino-4,6-dideoxygalactose transaminase
MKWPVYDEQQIEDVVNVLRSGQVNAWTGPYVGDFEKAYAQYLGREHAVAVTNGSAALDIALGILDLQPGDEVIVTPRSFVASASCIPQAGGKPVFADVDRESQNITAATIAPKITSRTRAIIAVHLGGWPCDMDDIMELAEAHNLVVIEDCAQAHGAELYGKPIGSFGHIACFSFCQDKIISTGGEGGMIALDDEDLFRKAWARKDHGKNYDTVMDQNHEPGFRWLHDSFGTNLRMTSIQAVLGLRQLQHLPAWIDKRAENAMVLRNTLRGSPAVRIPMPKQHIKHAYYRFYTFMDPRKLKRSWSRDRIIEESNRRGFPCFSGSCSEIYREKAFVDANLAPKRRLPVARELGETSLAFLVSPTLNRGAMEFYARGVREVINQATLH